MQRLYTTRDSKVTIAAAVSALTFPPPSVCAVPTAWETGDRFGVVPEVDLDIWSTAALSLTGAELWAAKTHPLTVADFDATSVSAATNQVAKVAHGLITGDGPLTVANTGGALPAGLVASTSYWVIKIDADHFQLAASLADALAATPVPVDITDAGTGTQTFSDVQTGVASTSTGRVVWHSLGLLTATIALDVQKAWTRRFSHSSGVVAYGITGTLSANTLLYAITPVVERPVKDSR